MKLVFVTRRFPPSMGGMQTLSAQLAREFSNRAETTTIAWGRSQAFLPYFLPSAFVRTLYASAFRGAEHVHLGDALLAPIGVLLRATARVSVSVTVNGRDIAFDSALYQFLVPRCLARLDAVVCVSRAIADECTRRGVPCERCVVIPNGVDPDESHVSTSRETLGQILQRDLDGHHVLVTVGRLVKKKGVEWFVREVMPLLPPDILYVVVGDGPERRTIEDAAERRGLEKRVVLLGAVPHEDPMLRTVYGGADLFVMPNEHVPGDFEGFGIVAVEAASAGLPVVASRVDGIEDAVLEGQTGHLVTPGAAEEFAARIQACLADESLDRDAVRSAAQGQFGWERVGGLYMKAIKDARSSWRAAAGETLSKRTMNADPAERSGYASVDLQSREKKAEKIRTILEAERELRGAALLEIGVGSGAIAARLADAVTPSGQVWGVDVRDARVVTEGFRFGIVEDTSLPFADGFFDVVVSNHVIEHVGPPPEQLAHLREIARVVKDDGLAYLATPNRWALLEPHFRLPLLSWLPVPARTPYVRLARRGRDYDCDPRTRPELLELCASAGLDVTERTLEAMRLTVEIENLPSLGRRLAAAPDRLLRTLLPLVPTHIVILRKSARARPPRLRDQVPRRLGA